MKNIYLFLAAVFFTLIVPGLEAQGSPSISLTVTLVGDSPKIGSEIRLRVTLTNVTQHQITVAAGWAEQLYKVDLREDSGKPVPKKQYYKFGSFSKVELPPGGSQQDDLELRHMYELTHSGTYLVQVTRKPWNEPGAGTENAKSNVLVLNVAPKETAADSKP